MASGEVTIHAHGGGIRTVIDARVFYYQARFTRYQVPQMEKNRSHSHSFDSLTGKLIVLKS